MIICILKKNHSKSAILYRIFFPLINKPLENVDMFYFRQFDDGCAMSTKITNRSVN